MAELRIFVYFKGDDLDNTPREVIPDKHGYVVVEEFDQWLLQESPPTDQGIYVRWGEGYLPLDQHPGTNEYVWPKDPGQIWKKKQRQELDRGQRTSGFLRFYRPDNLGRYHELKPALYVVAGSLYENDYVGLLDRLGQLAVAAHGAMTAPIEGPLPSDAGEYGAWIATPSFRQTLRIIAAYPLWKRSLERILEVPAHDTRRVAQRLWMGTAKSERAPGTCRQLARRPGKDPLLVPALEEHYETLENRFVVHALERLKGEAIGLAGLLRNDALNLRENRFRPPTNEVSALNLWNQGRGTAAQAAQQMDEMADALDKISEWAAKTRAQSFLKCLRPRLIQQPSLTLTRSPGYGTFYATYRHVFGSDTGGANLDAVRRGLAERTVRPTCELYEIWVFLETYRLLVEKFGFRPTDNGPMAHIELQMGRVELERRKPFDLELRLQNEPSAVYYIQLAYEPPVSYPACGPSKNCWLPAYCPVLKCHSAINKEYSRGPDVYISTEYRGSKKQFALDAKYRRYAEQPVNADDVTKFGYNDNRAIDTLGHAKQKYLNGIQFDAAWIVHSDPSFTYFGDVPFSIASPLRESRAGRSLYADHRYGAVYAVPYKTWNLEKLLRCLLMYHAGWYDICWTCRKRLVPRPGTGIRGVIYQCDQGHDFWVKSNCEGHRDHILIKMGAESFHHVTPNNVWNCECPKCGGRLANRAVRGGTPWEDLGDAFM